MRMWMTDPAIMCRQHLLGEHVEIHMFVGSINKGTRMDRFVSDGLLEYNSLRPRHHALVCEMKKRGYNHDSELPVIKQCAQMTPRQRAKRIDRAASVAELLRRCPECRANYEVLT